MKHSHTSILSSVVYSVKEAFLLCSTSQYWECLTISRPVLRFEVYLEWFSFSVTKDNERTEENFPGL